jgi:hypothetical protein
VPDIPVIGNDIEAVVLGIVVPDTEGRFTTGTDPAVVNEHVMPVRFEVSPFVIKPAGSEIVTCLEF